MSWLSRRKLITGGIGAAAGLSGLAVAARIAERYGLVPPDHGGIYGPGETLTYASQQLLARHSLAREFPRSMISKDPFADPVDPLGDSFGRLQAGGFADWRLVVDGMVAHPLSLSMSDLKTLPMSRHITEVACEEGWSYIAEWIGTPLSEVLNAAGALPQVRYVVYHSIQDGVSDSIDISEALHPQTLLTWGMNDGDLPVPFGGPLRMRLPRQLGYKNLKYITRLTATDSLKPGQDWGYAWYAGI
jgi:DMSO/TMAO reductase YedYZ molybdopterin-dependent catalytic subunit